MQDHTPVVESLLRLHVNRILLESFEMATSPASILEEAHHVKGFEEFALIFEDHYSPALGTDPVSAHIQYYHDWLIP